MQAISGQAFRRMATPPATEQPPSAWSVILHYSVTVTTIASAFLALSVTFAPQLTKTGDGLLTGLLITAWIALVVVILCSVTSIVYLIVYLKDGENRKNVIFFANAAYLILVGAALLFGLVGLVAINAGDIDRTAIAVKKAVSSVNVNLCKGAWRISAVNRMPRSDTLRIVLTLPEQPGQVQIIADSTGKLIDVQQTLDSCGGR